jgi:HAE1 family hydrophobic/amphiphilic exporter-1
VVNNGIVLIDHINQLCAQGLSRYEAIIQAGGLAFSTLVTLIILPEIYLLLDDLRHWSRRVLSSALK